MSDSILHFWILYSELWFWLTWCIFFFVHKRSIKTFVRRVGYVYIYIYIYIYSYIEFNHVIHYVTSRLYLCLARTFSSMDRRAQASRLPVQSARSVWRAEMQHVMDELAKRGMWFGSELRSVYWILGLSDDVTFFNLRSLWFWSFAFLICRRSVNAKSTHEYEHPIQRQKHTRGVQHAVL